MHEHTQEIRDADVETIMSEDFYTVHREMGIDEILDLFEKHSVPIFPVIDEDGNFVGDVHERDLLKLAIDRKHLNEHEIIGYMGTTIDESFFAESVKDIMQSHEVVARKDDRVGDIVLEMWKENIRAVPVLDENGEMAGVVYEKTVIEKVVEKLREKL